MPGNLDLRELEDLVRRDEIDTVLTVFPDVQGRLMGKRVVGRHFLGHVAGEGVHACAYLLTVDVDMEPLPGYKFASWATGYQDMKAVPDLENRMDEMARRIDPQRRLGAVNVGAKVHEVSLPLIPVSGAVFMALADSEGRRSAGPRG